MQQVLDETDKEAMGKHLDESSTDAQDEPELANNVSTAAFIANTIEKLQGQSRLSNERRGSKMSEKKSRNATQANTAKNVKQKVMMDVSDLLSQQRNNVGRYLSKSPTRIDGLGSKDMLQGTPSTLGRNVSKLIGFQTPDALQRIVGQPNVYDVRTYR